MGHALKFHSMPFLDYRKDVQVKVKLKYTFDAVDMGDEIVAVPVGDGADQIHGVVKLNKSGQEIMELMKNDITIEGIVDILAKKYDNSKEDLSNHVSHVIDVLRNAGVIDE